MTTHDTTLRFAIGTLDDAHRFESKTFAQDEGDKLCREVMERIQQERRPLVLVAIPVVINLCFHICEIRSGITGLRVGYLRTTNATGRIPGEA